jgi:hypothetical protein
MGRVQLLRRHVRRGDDAVRIDTDLEAIETFEPIEAPRLGAYRTDS